LTQTELAEALAAGDAQLTRHQVDVGDLLGHGVLHLDARIHFDEHIVAAFVQQKLYGAGAGIADMPGERYGIRTDAFPQCGIQVRRGSDLDDFLVPALHAAVPLVEVDDVAVGIGQDLHLDVARVDHRLLEEHRRVNRRPTRLPWTPPRSLRAARRDQSPGAFPDLRRRPPP
jgi:hypothetical protein